MSANDEVLLKTGSMRKVWELIFVWQLVFSLTNCGSEFGELLSSENSDANGFTSQTITSSVVGGHVSRLEIDASATPLTLSGSDNDTVLMVVSQIPDGEFQGFEIRSTSSVPQAPASNIRAGFLQDDVSSVMDTESLHLLLRDNETTFDPADVPETPRYAVKNLNTGGKRTFKVIHDFSNTDDYSTVTAVKVHDHPDFEIYMDERDLGKFNKTDFDRLIQKYESVLPVELDWLGHPSDIDHNGKFAILFTQEINAMTMRFGGLVTGFFYAIDLMDDTKYPASNEMEVFYSMVPDPSDEFQPSVPTALAYDIISGVLVHELQHMINFNKRFFERGLPPEEGWLNEGLSHLIEDIYSLDDNGYMTSSGAENPSRVGRYLSDITNICFVCGSSLEERGGSYLFLRYLYELAESGYLNNTPSGADLIRNFILSNQRGLKNLNDSAFGYPEAFTDFTEVLAQFGLGTYFSGSNEENPIMMEFSGIDLRGLQNDSRGTYLNGPSLLVPKFFPFSQVMEGYSVSFVQIPSDLLLQSGGKFEFIVNDPKNFQAYIIKK